MSTSGGTLFNAVLYLLAVLVALLSGLTLRGARSLSEHWDGRGRLVPVAVGTWLLVAVPSLLQIPFPVLLRALRRDPDLIRQHHQYWRLLTSLVVQDGGPGGTAFNLVLLAAVLAVAVPVLGRGTPAVLVGMQLVFDLAAVLWSADVGAGNSGATFGLAAFVAGAVAAGGRRPAVVLRAAGVLLIGAGLLGIGDLHGVAFVAGPLVGAALAGPVLGWK